MRRRNPCAYDLGAEDEDRFSTRLLCHLGRPGAADGRRFGTGGEPHWSIAAKDPAASSLQVTKGPASKGPPKTADRRSGQLSVAVCGRTSVHAAGVAGNPRTQWDVIENEELPAALARLPRPSVIQAFSAEDRATTDMVKNFLSRPIGSGGERKLPAARPWSCPD